MKPYIPNTLPLTNIPWKTLIKQISQANREVANFNGSLQGIINPFILLSPLSTQEAVLSSKIEGTMSTLTEVLEYEAVKEVVDEKKYADIQEILNYRSAMYTAIKKLQNRPITLNILKEIHEILMNSVRGHNKRRGEFRRNQNWIGCLGCNIENASFVPPDPIHLNNLLDNFEKYIHYDEDDPLVQIAILHAQFEMLHPFMDGNGRVGRMLIPLFLFEKGVISSPNFYVSSYLESHRNEYYEGLQDISRNNNWEGWIKFFLKVLIEESKKNTLKVRKIISLYNEMKNTIPELTRSQYAIAAVDHFFAYPIFCSSTLIKRSKIPKSTASRILKVLQKEKTLKIIKEGKGRKPSTLAFIKLLEIIEE